MMPDRYLTGSWEHCLCRSCALFRADMFVIGEIAATFSDPLTFGSSIRVLQEWYVEGRLVLSYTAMNLTQ